MADNTAMELEPVQEVKVHRPERAKLTAGRVVEAHGDVPEA
jgi:hypothetical protein